MNAPKSLFGARAERILLRAEVHKWTRRLHLVEIVSFLVVSKWRILELIVRLLLLGAHMWYGIRSLGDWS
jgi:hypothetical protein